MHCSDVDQYRPASLPDSLGAAQGVCLSRDLCCSNHYFDNILFLGLNPSMLDRGLVDFWSTIDAL